jgi:Uma2 family endonuclease
MAVEQATRRMTAEELEQFEGEPDKRYELVDGELIAIAPAGGQHGEHTFEVSALIGDFVRPRRLGKIYAAETGFILRRSPDLVRAPDVAFIANERLPNNRSPEGFIPIAPDFVVEVVSPSDRAAKIQRRIDDWLKAGTTVVWALYASTRTVFIYRRLDRIDRRSGDDELDVEPVLPGFRCKVSDLFPTEST